MHENIVLYMKRRVITLLMLSLSVSMMAQMKWNQSYQQYFDQYKDLAIEQMMKYRIPASITLAQGVFESGAGKSELARRGNNHFGIKCHGWRGAKTYHTDDAPNECFRAYKNVYESYEDHSKFLANGRRYSNLFRLKITDYKGWARGLKAAGYATNPQYANRLINIIELYGLYRYDTAKSYDKFFARHAKDQAVNGILHAIYAFNDNYYIKVRRGDTFNSLAEELDVSARSLAKYNELDRDAVLSEGDIVYLKKKKKRVPKEFRGRIHYVRPGESMYSIAQLYGIRIKYLYKMNRLSPDYQIKLGDGLLLN